jgi:hypothetical protein
MKSGLLRLGVGGSPGVDSTEPFSIGTVAVDSVEPFDIESDPVAVDSVEPFDIEGYLAVDSVEPFDLGDSVVLDSVEPFDIVGPSLGGYLSGAPAWLRLGWRDRRP